ncbi:MAG TPA: SAM-dependent methyltransferase [Rhizomicrobium sp.]|nr:SAM-dependent methyltransferase [Rhizomicrobium sp.]
MNPLGERLARLIDAQGPISVAAFMAEANRAYYASRDPLGRDFITAPEISQVFGELIGLWMVQAWDAQGRPRAKRLVELGPGRGTLMADALRAARAVPGFLDRLEIVFVETSPALRAEQAKRVPGARWADRFEAGDAPLFLIANEFFDALPIRQFVKTAEGWRERMIVVADGALGFALSPLVVPGPAAPDGTVRETCPTAQAVVAEIAHGIAHRGGAALIVDYGYDQPGFGETLQAVRGNAFADILGQPGETDLSAHVDFAALAAAASEAAVYGTTQGTFLRSLGIVTRIARLAAANPAQRDDLHAALDRLADPAQMGTLFKALAILPFGSPRPLGF